MFNYEVEREIVIIAGAIRAAGTMLKNHFSMQAREHLLMDCGHLML